MREDLMREAALAAGAVLVDLDCVTAYGCALIPFNETQALFVMLLLHFGYVFVDDGVVQFNIDILLKDLCTCLFICILSVLPSYVVTNTVLTFYNLIVLFVFVS